MPDNADHHAALISEATRLAGGPDDLAQRAQVYLHLYRHSGGRHGFPLLAAHGALWAAGHFRRGAWAAHLLSLSHADRATRRARVQAFARAFKEINVRVCIETYATYHLTAAFGADGAVAGGVDPALATALDACHAARRTDRAFSTAEQRALFTAFFRWEQDNVVQSAIDTAREALDWPLLDRLAMRPPIRFAYFPGVTHLWFRRFADKDERIAQGNRAFDLACAVGWDQVEASLDCYGLLPCGVTQNPGRAYDTMLERLGIPPRPMLCPA